MTSLALAFDLLGRDKSAGRTFDKIADKSEKTGRRVSTAFAGVGAKIAAGFAVIGTVSVFKGFISEAEESRRIGRLTEQVIKSTGGAAQITAKQVEGLATAISNKSGVDDEAIQSGANLLLTFTNVRNAVGKGNDIFDRATQAITDMSVALGQDTKSSAIQLGKALNDPIKGVTALSRVGVSFTKQQKDQIKTLVESGDTLGAQKVILAELSKEFGGAAAAAASPTQKLGVIFGNLKEQIGTALLPMVDRLATFLGERLIPGVTRLSRSLNKTLGPAVRSIARGLRVFFDALAGKSEINEFSGKLKVANNAGIRLREGFQRLAKFIRTQVIPAAREFGLWFNTNVIPALKATAQFIQTRVIPAMKVIAQFIVTQVVPAVAKLWERLSKNLQPAFDAIAKFIQQRVLPALQGLWKRVQEISPTLQKVAKIVLTVVGALLVLAAKILGTVIPIVLKLGGPVFTLLFGAIGKVIGIISGIVGAFIWLGSKAGALGAKIGSLASGIVKAFTGLPGRIRSATAGMFDGIKDAFKSAINWVIDKWNGLEFSIPGVNTHIPTVGTIGGFTLGTPNIPRLADGGWVRGRGGPRSDLVPLMASAGEFVSKESVARKYGPVLEAMNAGKDLALGRGGVQVDIHGGIHVPDRQTALNVPDQLRQSLWLKGL